MIPFDLERSLKIFRKFFDFEVQRELKRFPSQLVFGISLLFVGTGFIFDILFMLILGISMLVFTTVILGFFLAK